MMPPEHTPGESQERTGNAIKQNDKNIERKKQTHGFFCHFYFIPWQIHMYSEFWVRKILKIAG